MHVAVGKFDKANAATKIDSFMQVGNYQFEHCTRVRKSGRDDRCDFTAFQLEEATFDVIEII